MVGELAGEGSGRVVTVGLEVGGRDLDPEVPLAVLARSEVADEREQRPDLSAEVLEMGFAPATDFSFSSRPASSDSR